MVTYSTDTPRLLEHFRKDPALFAYHIGDLDPFHFDFCRWAVLPDEAGWVEECVLLYSGLAIPTVLAFGLGSRFDDFLRDLLPDFPPTFYGHFQERSRAILTETYSLTDYGNNFKMQLGQLRAPEITLDRRRLRRLAPDDLPLLEQLYRDAYPGNFFVPRMLETGQYLGYVDNDRLVAVTGVHVYSEEYGVCALGNVATHPDWRGRGLATQLTSLLLSGMVARGMRVSLNVRAENAPAIRSYEKLGFVRAHEYREGLCKRK